jgi:hypothetical protein
MENNMTKKYNVEVLDIIIEQYLNNKDNFNVMIKYRLGVDRVSYPLTVKEDSVNFAVKKEEYKDSNFFDRVLTRFYSSVEANVDAIREKDRNKLNLLNTEEAVREALKKENIKGA